MIYVHTHSQEKRGGGVTDPVVEGVWWLLEMLAILFWSILVKGNMLACFSLKNSLMKGGNLSPSFSWPNCNKFGQLASKIQNRDFNF